MISLKAMSLLMNVFAMISVEKLLGLENNFNSIPQAIMDSYDIDKNFRDNFFTLLHFICPNSVQCDIERTSDLPLTYLEGLSNDTYYLSNDLFPNRNTSLMNEARAYLEEEFKSMTGCCKQCYCLDQCRENNCCPLNVAIGQTGNKLPLTIKQQCIAPGESTEGKGIYMVTDCLNSSVDDELQRKCKHPNIDVKDEMIPVYSNLTDLIYKNKYCARCNNEFRVILLEQKVFFSLGSTLLEGTHFQKSSDALYQIARRSVGKAVHLSLVLPDELTGRQQDFECILPWYIRETVRFKEYMSENQIYFFKHACSYFDSPYKSQYRNAFCYIAGIHNLKKDKEQCSTDEIKININSFTAVLVTRDPTSADVETLSGSRVTRCTCKEYYDDQTRTCRQVVCPPLTNYLQCSCEPFLKQIYGLNVEIFLELSIETQVGPFMDVLNDENPNIAVSKIQSGINQLFRKRWGPMEIEHTLMYRKSSLSDPLHETLYINLFIRSKRVTENMPLLETIYKHLRSSVSFMVLKTPMIMSLGKILDYAGFPLFRSNINYTSVDGQRLSRIFLSRGSMMHGQYLTKLLFCRRITLNSDEVSLLTNYSLKAGYNLNDLHYIFEVSKQQMCLNDFINIFATSTEPRYISSSTQLLVILGVVYLLLIL